LQELQREVEAFHAVGLKHPCEQEINTKGVNSENVGEEE